MGAIHNSLDIELVAALRKTLPLRDFVETGTFLGATAAAMAAVCERVFTIELSQPMFDRAAPRLKTLPNVSMIYGGSPEALAQLNVELRSRSVIYWLDAHWSGEITSGVDNECPLLDELMAIGRLNDESVVLIDDARFFVAPPPSPHNVAHWPTIDEVVIALRAMSRNHKLWIINDVIVFAPAATGADVIDYSRTHGADLNRLNVKAGKA